MKASLVFLCLSLSALASSPVHVKPTVTKKGEYRQAHVRTAPDHTQRNNWSSKPNVNPYAGKAGTRTPKK